MKTTLLRMLLFGMICLTISCSREKEAQKELVIYAYDSFVSEWGPAGQVIPAFEEKYGITVDIRSAGDSGQMLSRAILETDKPEADIIIGIDNNLLARALEADILEPYKPVNIGIIPKEFLFDSSFHLVPFDYGFFSIIYDSSKIKNPPASLEDLTEEQYKDSFIIMDPRTSSPGFGLLLWTVAVFGNNYKNYWEKLKPSLLTITDGWDSGYGLFTSGEAPMVLSYTTSPAYHVEFEKTNRFRATIFKNGNYMQIEGMGILKGAAHRKAAEKFIEFMLTETFQKELPLTNFMFPVNPDVKLPDSFDYALEPEKILLLKPDFIKENQESWIQGWISAVSK